MSLRDLYGKNLQDLTAEEMRRVIEAPDEELIRNSVSWQVGTVVESQRRLRVAIIAEERSIRRLTCWLVVFTIALVILTGALVCLGVIDYRRHRSDDAIAPVPAAPAPAREFRRYWF